VLVGGQGEVWSISANWRECAPPILSALNLDNDVSLFERCALSTTNASWYCALASHVRRAQHEPGYAMLVEPPRGSSDAAFVPGADVADDDPAHACAVEVSGVAGGRAVLTITCTERCRVSASAEGPLDELLLLRAGVARFTDSLLVLGTTLLEDGMPPITYINDTFERQTGWTRDDILGRSSGVLAGPGTAPDAVQRLREAFAKVQPLRIESRQCTLEGREFWAELDLEPIFDASGAHTHWIGILRDVSERRLLEEQLYHAQKLEAVGRLAGGVAHDFNNLLTAISGFSELLLEELPPGTGPHGEVQQIKSAAERATALTRQLLAFSRKQIMRPVHVDVNALIIDMERLIRRVIGAQVSIRTIFEEPLPAVHTDPTQLEQVLLNLVVNASDAMPDGGTLTIETGTVTLGEAYAARHHGVVPGPYVCLIVSDTGTGMDRETRDRIFEPFFTTKAGGTGLGLSTVYGIVRQSGGHIWVYSEGGIGTTFKVYLPVSGHAPTPHSAPEVVQTFGGTETILVVEDEDAVREVARAMLQRRGYSVLVARDGDQAMRVAKAHLGPIDLLLTDVVLPRANGRRVAERLRSERPGTRVLFMSGYTEEAVVHQGVLDAGARLLEKPFSEAALTLRVREVLDLTTE
jgi:PAS domain S-box-containing protein